MIFLATAVFIFLIRLRFPRGTSIIQVIERRYGRSTVNIYRKYERLNKKFDKCKCDIAFLMKCKAFNIVPKFLNFKLYKSNLYNSKFYKKCQFKLLQNELNTKNKLLKDLDKRVLSEKERLKSVISYIDFVCLNNFVDRCVSKYSSAIENTHDKKLKSLGITNNLNSLDPNKVIYNFSKRKLTSKEQALLAFGLNFKLPNFKINFFKYFTAFENLYKLLTRFSVYNPGDNFNYKFQDKFKSIAMKNFYNFKPWKVFSPIFTKNDVNILKNLSKDNSITICRPDKGRGVVILNKSDYSNKMYDILNDKTKFQEIQNTDPLLYTLRAEDKINNKIRIFKKLKIIDDDLSSTLTVSGTSPGILYGLPKIHKTGVPMRPILAAYNTPSYNLSKFIVSKLNHLTTNEFTIKNSYEFAELLTNTSNKDYIMCSFDIKSLFTNIPLDETINIILNELTPNLDSKFNNLNRSQLKNILQLACKNSFFIFNNKLYKQLDGVAMGTPCGPTLANIFLCFHEARWLRDCPNNFKPLMYKRYVDDTFLLFKKHSHIELFLNYLNKQHQNIKFTCEIEHNNTLPFLDINVNKNNCGFTTSIYRKDTFTGLGTHFLSFDPMKFKINAIRTLIYRAYNLCSSYFNIHKELEFLKNFFHNNGYPEFIFLREISNFFKKIYIKKPSVPTVPKQKVYFPLPYYGYISEIIKKEIKELVEKHIPQIELNLIFTNSFSIASIFKHKEKLIESLCSCVVYEYRCVLCNKHYIGSTSRQLPCRISEHMGISVRTNLPLSTTPNSAICNHESETGHRVQKSSFKIISFSNKLSLRTVEALHIIKNKPELNSGLPVELSLVH